MILAVGDKVPWTLWGWILGDGLPEYLRDRPFIVGAYLAALVVVIISFWGGARLRNVDSALIPEEGVTLGNFFTHFLELIADFIYDLAKTIIGHDAPKHMWLLGALFVFILVGNLMGLVPGLYPPTIDLNVNLGMGALVFLLYNLHGFISNGPGYLKHFWAPAGLGILGFLLGPLILVIEGIGHLVRPASLSLRLYGNITGDHAVFDIFLNMVPLGVPILVMTFGTLVSFVQAFVFTLLTAVYIGMATAHDH